MKTLIQSALAFLISVFLLAESAVAQSDFWQQANGPLGATVEKVVVNPVNDDIFIYIAENGIFRSTDSGASWFQTTGAGLANVTLNTLAFNESGDLFAGTSGGIYRSSDNGESWQLVYSGTNRTRDIKVLAINPQNGEIFGGASSVQNATIIRSSDNGDSWTEFTNDLADVRALHSLAINASNGQLYVATDRGGVLTSSNRGEAWTPVDTTLKLWGIKKLFVHSNGDVFAGADSTLLRYAIFRLAANASQWVKVQSISSEVLSFAENSSALYAGTSRHGVFLSPDNGASWQDSNNGLLNFRINGLAVDRNERLIAGTFCAGVFVSSDNAGNWVGMNEDLKFATVLSLVVHPASGDLFAGTDCAGIYRSSDKGETWTQVGLPGAPINAMLVNAAGHIFAANSFFTPLGSDGNVYRSIDNGNSWQRVSNINDFVFSLAIHPNGDLYAGTGFFQLCGLSFCDFGDIYRSQDGGSSWQAVASKLDDHVFGLAINANGRVFAGTREGIYRNFAEFWHKISSFNTASLFVNPATNDVFAGTSGGIWRSSNEGENWDYVRASNFIWTFINDNDGNILAGTEKEGVLMSPDNGDTWSSLSSGLKKMNIRALAADPATGQLFAGLVNGSVFKSLDATGLPLPATPVLASPGDNAINQPVSLTLSWNASAHAATYHLQVAGSANFESTIIDDSTLTTTTATIGPLANSTMYYWRVRATNATGTSAWSEVRQFTTITALPAAISLLLPAHNAVFQVREVQFSWQMGQPNVDRYWFEIATDSTMANAAVDSNLSATDTVKVIADLANMQDYWWRVRAGNIAGWGPFSGQRKVRIDVPTGIADAGGIPTEFGLAQNYPNPFNPSTVISYQLPMSSVVKLSIHSITGQLVRTLVDGSKPAGTHQVMWDGRNDSGERLPSGVYLYRIEAGDFSAVRRLAMVK